MKAKGVHNIPAVCVICGKWLTWPRQHANTCGDRCYRALLRRQRINNAYKDNDKVALRDLGVKIGAGTFPVTKGHFST